MFGQEANSGNEAGADGRLRATLHKMWSFWPVTVERSEPASESRVTNLWSVNAHLRRTRKRGRVRLQALQKFREAHSWFGAN